MNILKSIGSALLSLSVPGMLLAHSGHGEPGITHDMTHAVWIAAAIIFVGFLAVRWLSRKESP